MAHLFGHEVFYRRWVCKTRFAGILLLRRSWLLCIGLLRRPLSPPVPYETPTSSAGTRHAPTPTRASRRTRSPLRRALLLRGGVPGVRGGVKRPSGARAEAENAAWQCGRIGITHRRASGRGNECPGGASADKCHVIPLPSVRRVRTTSRPRSSCVTPPHAQARNAPQTAHPRCPPGSPPPRATAAPAAAAPGGSSPG